MHVGKTAWDAPTTPSRVVLPVDRLRVDPGLLKSAQGMEALFLDHLFQVMRQTVQKSDLDLESSASQIYRGMLDSRYADQISHGARGMGIADQIITYYDSQARRAPLRSLISKKAVRKENP
jgi:Rod binding domain-containing protein